MIVLFHVVNSKLPTLPFLADGTPLLLTRSLEHGVELFFGISGIVIVGALQRASGPFVFAIDRFTRIYPVLWAAVTVLVILSALTGFQGRGLPGVGEYIANLLALPPLLPGMLIHPAAWSLSYELLFYAFCAAIWMLRRHIGVWAMVIAVPLAGALLFYHVRAVLMPVGMIAALLMERRPQLARFVPAPGLCLIAFLIVWEMLCGRNQGELMDVPIGSMLHSLDILLLGSAVAFASLCFAGILAGRGLLSRALNAAPMQFLGTISYSLYLWHPIVMAMVKHAMYGAHLPDRLGPLTQFAFFALILLPSLAVGWLSQITLEKRVTRWLRLRIEPSRRERGKEVTPMASSHGVESATLGVQAAAE